MFYYILGIVKLLWSVDKKVRWKNPHPQTCSELLVRTWVAAAGTLLVYYSRCSEPVQPVCRLQRLWLGSWPPTAPRHKVNSSNVRVHTPPPRTRPSHPRAPRVCPHQPQLAPSFLSCRGFLAEHGGQRKVHQPVMK